MARRVYVIELALAAGPRRDPRIPWVYVGSSARDPELRFAQHLRGYKSGRLVRRHGLRLRPDLYDDLEPLPSSRAAVAAEQARARELANAGFVAHCDGTSYGDKGGTWREWDAKRLAAVAEHVDAAAVALAECSFSPLESDRCVRILRGERGFWLADHIDPADPPPEFGLFAHAGTEALGAHLETSRALVR